MATGLVVKPRLNSVGSVGIVGGVVSCGSISAKSVVPTVIPIVDAMVSPNAKCLVVVAVGIPAGVTVER